MHKEEEEGEKKEKKERRTCICFVCEVLQLEQTHRENLDPFSFSVWFLSPVNWNRVRLWHSHDDWKRCSQFVVVVVVLRLSIRWWMEDMKKSMKQMQNIK
jgi:hypothetical protein